MGNSMSSSEVAPEAEAAPASWLKGKNIMITGCTAGIGQAAARSIATLQPKCDLQQTRHASCRLGVAHVRLAAARCKHLIRTALRQHHRRQRARLDRVAK